MLDRTTGETHSIDCTKSLGNIYGNKFQTYHLKGKTYRDAQLEELIHSVMVKHTSEHEVVCGSKLVGEKCGEGETADEWQPPRALGREAAMSSRGWQLRVAKTRM
jgi:hypothetical protein